MLKKSGIKKLEKIMLANGKYFYNQSVFARESDCGTELCAAGFARLLKVGEDKLKEEIENEGYHHFCTECEQAGIDLLGLKVPKATDTSETPQIFEGVGQWPMDLYQAYMRANTPQERIGVYINMLRTRANDDGSIREEK